MICERHFAAGRRSDTEMRRRPLYALYGQFHAACQQKMQAAQREERAETKAADHRPALEGQLTDIPHGAPDCHRTRLSLRPRVHAAEAKPDAAEAPDGASAEDHAQKGKVSF